jgi:hypothetical protein
MNLDKAQRLSLIQRNLEAAQVNMDSAVELLHVVMEEEMKEETVQRAKQTARELTAAAVDTSKPQWGLAGPPPVKGRGRPKKVSKTVNGSGKVATTRTGPGSISDAIRQYVAEHKGQSFRAGQVFNWSQSVDYPFSKQQIAQNLHSLYRRNNGGLDKDENGYHAIGD